MEKSDEFDEQIGDKIRTYREARKMTQEDFGKRLGLTAASVSAYENETRKPSYSILIRIANILGVTTDNLLGRTIDRERILDISGLTSQQLNMVQELVDMCLEYNRMKEKREKEE